MLTQKSYNYVVDRTPVLDDIPKDIVLPEDSVLDVVDDDNNYNFIVLSDNGLNTGIGPKPVYIGQDDVENIVALVENNLDDKYVNDYAFGLGIKPFFH